MGRFVCRTLASVCNCALVAALALVASTVSAQVLVVLSDEAAVYQDVAGELKSRLAPLREGRLRIDVVTAAGASALDDGAYAAYELIVTVGLAAAQTAVAHHDARGPLPPTLCLLVSRQTFDGLVKVGATERVRRVSAVFVEQPITRQLDLISLAFPAKSRIGAVFGPTSVALAGDIQDIARDRGFALNRIDVADASGVYPALQKILQHSDLLLALPDPVALNASTAHGVLVTSYRAQVPVVGFSQAMVDAGALVAVYSTARQQGRQGAEIAGRVLTGEAELPAPQYPRYFTVGVNFIAARSLGLRMEDESALAAGLAERSRDSAGSRKPSLSGGGAAATPRKVP
jgi:putative tryptophan/tyrosine transport system substrate-binding protein